MNRRPEPPTNGDLAEALFALSEREQPGERRLAFLHAAYTAFDAVEPAQRAILDAAPSWLRPLVSQLVTCQGRGALDAAVGRLSAGGQARRRQVRENFLARRDAVSILENAREGLRPERMRGACHWHTRDSDGKATLETMARTCQRRGLSWGLVTDHSRGLEVASGLDREGVRLQRRRVDRWNHRYGDDFRLFQGLEVEILEDGTVDVSAPERSEIECVVAAVHRDFDPDRDQTERLLRAIASPDVRVLAHPRARHFHQRPGLRVRWEKVFAAALEHDVAVEINGFPRRQDLDPDLARLAADAGCGFLLASDAHAPAHLEFDGIACAIADLAGIEPAAILNARQAEAFADWLIYGA